MISRYSASTLLLALLPAVAVSWSAGAQQQTSAIAPLPAVAPQTIKAEPQPTGCITETGSRLQRDGACLNGVPGRAYDRGDLDRTGEDTVGAALSRLDPGVRVSPH